MRHSVHSACVGHYISELWTLILLFVGFVSGVCLAALFSKFYFKWFVGFSWWLIIHSLCVSLHFGFFTTNPPLIISLTWYLFYFVRSFNYWEFRKQSDACLCYSSQKVMPLQILKVPKGMWIWYCDDCIHMFQINFITHSDTFPDVLWQEKMLVLECVILCWADLCLKITYLVGSPS